MIPLTYSIIIPHHNSPDLLQRCINSIPERSDIEIVIVDDNSDLDKLPNIDRINTSIIKIDAQASKGAGRARNYGMLKAKGKWLLFADCDDYYANNFISYLDVYKDSNYDMICFNVYYAYDLNKHKERWKNNYADAIEKYMKYNKNEYWLRTVKHIIQGPWNFMVRRELVNSIGARFEEVPKGNDAYFHHFVSMNCHNVAIIKEKLYYWIWNEGSITHKLESKETLLANITRNIIFTQYRIDAKAWNTIPSFFKGLGQIYLNYGVFFTLKYIKLKLFCGIPWLKIWWHIFSDFIKYKIINA